jgi:DNA-binding MarR family transcriptional regulator
MLLACLHEKEPMAPRQMAKHFNIPLRTVSFALKRLREQKLIVRVPNLIDMRKPLYQVDDTRIGDLWQKLEEIKMKSSIHLRTI